ncbi:MAG: DNRLRE domain-containing protein [Myxococcaceae bacterium]
MNTTKTNTPALILILTGTLLAPEPALAQRTLTFRDGESPSAAYSGTRDIWLRWDINQSWQPDQTYADAHSTRQFMDAFTYANGTVAFTPLLRWDLSSLSTAVTIEAVRLEVRGAMTNPPSIHKVVRPWTASEVTWNRAAAGSPWAIPGALGAGSDFDPAQLTSAPQPMAGGWLVWNFNATGIAVVAGWIAGSIPNNGLLIQAVPSGGSSSETYFDANGITPSSSRPVLIITYDGGQVAAFQQGVSGYSGSVMRQLANYADPVTYSYRAYDYLAVDASPEDTALLSWDLSTAVPAWSQVVSAAVALTTAEPSLGPSANTFRVSAVRRPWTENATWATADGATAWNGGGARGAADTEVTELARVGTLSLGLDTTSFNAAGIAVVQEWVSGQRRNDGIAVLHDGSNGDGYRFASRRRAAVTSRPGLIVAYWEGDLQLDTTASLVPQGTSSAPMQLRRSARAGGSLSAGAPIPGTTLSVNVSALSPTGEIGRGTAPNYTWTRSATISFAAGNSVSESFVYRDSNLGTANLELSAPSEWFVVQPAALTVVANGGPTGGVAAPAANGGAGLTDGGTTLGDGTSTLSAEPLDPLTMAVGFGCHAGSGNGDGSWALCLLAVVGLRVRRRCASKRAGTIAFK